MVVLIVVVFWPVVTAVLSKTVFVVVLRAVTRSLPVCT